MCVFIKENLSWLIPLIITVIFSVLNIIVAWQNYTNNKLQKDLLNAEFCFKLSGERMEVYNNIRAVFRELYETSKVTNQLVFDYLKATTNLNLLFGKDITDISHEIHILLVKKLALDTATGVAIKNDKTDSSEFIQKCEDSETLLFEINNNIETMNKLFENYIYFGDYKISNRRKI